MEMWEGIEQKIIGEKKPTTYKIVQAPSIKKSSVDKIAHLKASRINEVLAQFESPDERERATELL